METESLSDPAEDAESWDVREGILLLMLLLNPSRTTTRVETSEPFKTDPFFGRFASSDKYAVEVNTVSASVLNFRPGRIDLLFKRVMGYLARAVLFSSRISPLHGSKFAIHTTVPPRLGT